MRSQPVESRVVKVEKRLAMLEQLPEKVEEVELQIVQLRGEMRDEFAALRREVWTATVTSTKTAPVNAMGSIALTFRR